MTKLSRAWAWFKKWAWVFAVATAGILVMILRRSKGEDPLKAAKLELEALDAKADVKRIEAKHGAQEALAEVEYAYDRELAALDQEQKTKAEKLRKDPAALAAFLVRAGKK